MIVFIPIASQKPLKTGQHKSFCGSPLRFPENFPPAVRHKTVPRGVLCVDGRFHRIHFRRGETVFLLESLYETHRSAMLSRTRSVLGDPGLAEDAVHEAFLRIARHLPRFKALSEQESRYLCLAIAKNAALNLRRDRGEACPLAEDLPSAAADPSLGMDLTGAIAALEDSHRQVVLLRLHYGFNTAETARLLGITRDAVRGRLKRARGILREALGNKTSDSRGNTDTKIRS